MAHHERKPKEPANYRPIATAAPFATYGNHNVTDSTDFGNPANKTKPIKEPKKEGVGHRLAKNKMNEDRRYGAFHNDEDIRAALKSAPQAPRYAQPKPPEEGRNDMSKLLSYGYQRDWVDDQKRWWSENEGRAVRFAEEHGLDNIPPQHPAVAGSEYSQQYPQYSNTHPRQAEAYANAGRMNQGAAPYGN